LHLHLPRIARNPVQIEPELNEGSSEVIAARQIEPALPGVGSVTFTTGFACAMATDETKAGASAAAAMPAKTSRRDNKTSRRDNWRPVAALNMDRPFDERCLRNELNLAGKIRKRRATRGCFCRP
jgi:hypothetical protein